MRFTVDGPEGSVFTELSYIGMLNGAIRSSVLFSGWSNPCGSLLNSIGDLLKVPNDSVTDSVFLLLGIDVKGISCTKSSICPDKPDTSSTAEAVP